jgi:hypothetical protein
MNCDGASGASLIKTLSDKRLCMCIKAAKISPLFDNHIL